MKALKSILMFIACFIIGYIFISLILGSIIALATLDASVYRELIPWVKPNVFASIVRSVVIYLALSCGIGCAKAIYEYDNDEDAKE